MLERFSSKVREAYARLGPTEARGLSFQAATATTPATLRFYDVIGFDTITTGAVTEALAKAGDGPLQLRINSPGGDVFEGMGIYNVLAARGNVEVVVDGLAASIATIIALAGSTITMADSSMWMIHNSWSADIGDRHAKRAAADVQEKIDGQMAGIYSAKTGSPAKDMAAAMDAETWFTATEAKEAGFVDDVLDPPKPAGRRAEGYGGAPAAPVAAEVVAEVPAVDPAEAARTVAARARKLRLRELSV